MSIQMSRATAQLIVALVEPQVRKAMEEGDIKTAKAFQHIISTIDLALETGAPIEFEQRPQ